MRLLQRQSVPQQRLSPELVVHAPRLYDTKQVGERTDLICPTCERTIAYGVATERLADDVRFFLQQHAPFCCRV